MTVHKRWLIPFSEELVTWRQYVFIALMIVLILVVGVGDPATRELIYPASVATLVVVMEVIGFALLALGLFITISSCGHADLLTLDTSVTNCSSDRYRRDPNSHRISSNMGTFLKTVKTRDSSPLFKESR